MRQNRSGLIILILIIIIAVLIMLLLYAFLLRPYLIERQAALYNQGYQQAMNNAILMMVSDIQQRGYTQLSLENQTIILAPVQVEQPQTVE